MFKPIFRTDKIYVECQHTNFVSCSVMLTGFVTELLYVKRLTRTL